MTVLASKAMDAFDYYLSNQHILKSGDNLTLSFGTDEPLDKLSLNPTLKIGGVDRSVELTDLSGGLSWDAN